MEKMKMRLGLTSLKDVLHFSTHDSFLARVLLLIEGNIRQIATYKQHVPSTVIFLVSRNAAMCIDHCTFWLQYWMSITHCMLCRNLMFWKTYCMIESRLNITMKGRKTTLLQKGTLHVWRTPLYFVGIRFLERSNALPWRKIAAHKWKVYVEMKTFARAALCLIDECIIMCMGA